MTFLYKETAVLNTLIFPKVDGFYPFRPKIFGFQPSVIFSETFDSWFSVNYFTSDIFILPITISCFFDYLSQNSTEIEEFSFILITSFLLYYFTFILIPAEGPGFFFRFRKYD